MAHYKNDQDSNITHEEWELVNYIILLLEPFFCSKGVQLLSSVIPHAKSLTKFVKFNENSEEVSNVCTILAKNIGDACKRRFYTRVSQTLFQNTPIESLKK